MDKPVFRLFIYDEDQRWTAMLLWCILNRGRAGGWNKGIDDALLLPLPLPLLMKLGIGLKGDWCKLLSAISVALKITAEKIDTRLPDRQEDPRLRGMQGKRDVCVTQPGRLGG